MPLSDLERLWERAVLVMYDIDPQEADMVGRGRVIECSPGKFVVRYPKELPHSKVARRRIPTIKGCLAQAQTELLDEFDHDLDMERLEIVILPEPRNDCANV